MIVLTPEAVAAVKNAMARVGKPQAGLRIMIETGGCAGHKYLIGLDEEPRPDDAVIECGGVKVFVDPDFATAYLRAAGRLRRKARRRRFRFRQSELHIQMLMRQVVPLRK